MEEKNSEISQLDSSVQYSYSYDNSIQSDHQNPNKKSFTRMSSTNKWDTKNLESNILIQLF